jgi:hypothetical protein
MDSPFLVIDDDVMGLVIDCRSTVEVLVRFDECDLAHFLRLPVRQDHPSPPACVVLTPIQSMPSLKLLASQSS